MNAQVADKFERALAFHHAGDFALAQSLYTEILSVHPADFDALHLLGVIELQTRNLSRAVELLNQAIHSDPGKAVAHFNRGLALQELQQVTAALASYERAIALDDGFVEAYSNRGLVLQALQRPAEALASFDRALQIRPGYACAHYNRGVQLHALERFEEALASYDAAIALDPAYADAHFNRADLHRQLGRLEAARADYDRVIALKPDGAGGYCNRGALRQEVNDVDGALEDYDRALALRPEFPQAHVNRAFALLLKGDFAQGFREYEWRWQVEQVTGAPPAGLPLWLGESSLKGRTILLRSEQGFGDTLQFCRYVPLLAASGARVILEVPRELHALMRGLDGVHALRVPGEPLPPLDCHCPMLSLPLAFGTTLASVPARVPYLRSHPQQVAYWNALLGSRTKPRVGLVWSGGVRSGRRDRWAANHHRNIPLALCAALGHPGIALISLQKGAQAEAELAQFKQLQPAFELTDHTDQLGDFSDTAALIEALDLVISVDTATAHLAGALGKPVWILNRVDTCWRWLIDTPDSPWYPTARLYRQQRAGEWEPVLAQVRTDLDRLVG